MNIFLADDHNLVREGLANLLNALGHTIVGEAETVKELVHKINTSEVDVLISDYDMPEGDILSTLHDIKSHAASLKIIILTGLKQVALYERILSHPVEINGLLLKDASADELNAAIEAVSLDKQYIQFSIQKRISEPTSKLTKRQLEILEYLSIGKTNKQIAETLNISIKTVETHRMQIMKKLKTSNVVELINVAKNKGLI